MSPLDHTQECKSSFILQTPVLGLGCCISCSRFRPKGSWQQAWWISPLQRPLQGLKLSLALWWLPGHLRACKAAHHKGRVVGLKVPLRPRHPSGLQGSLLPGSGCGAKTSSASQKRLAPARPLKTGRGCGAKIPSESTKSFAAADFRSSCASNQQCQSKAVGAAPEHLWAHRAAPRAPNWGETSAGVAGRGWELKLQLAPAPDSSGPLAGPEGPQGYSSASPRPVLGQSSGGLFAAPASKNSRVSEFCSFWKDFNQFLFFRADLLQLGRFPCAGQQKGPPRTVRGLGEDWARTGQNSAKTAEDWPRHNKHSHTDSTGDSRSLDVQAQPQMLLPPPFSIGVTW